MEPDKLPIIGTYDLGNGFTVEGTPQGIETIIKKAIDKSIDCIDSDPLIIYRPVLTHNIDNSNLPDFLKPDKSIEAYEAIFMTQDEPNPLTAIPGDLNLIPHYLILFSEQTPGCSYVIPEEDSKDMDFEQALLPWVGLKILKKAWSLNPYFNA